MTARTWLLLLWVPTAAFALDKQGSAHGGDSGAGGDGFNVSGAVMLGAALYNPSYAARPDNTGLALFRYAAHLDIDLVGPLLSIPIDVNLFTNRERPGAGLFAPTEFDVIVGLTTTRHLGPGAFEYGMRVEHDRPVDEGTFTQTYVDARARYLVSLNDSFPKLGDALWEGDVNGWVTLGSFLYNPSYAARPDNSGNAFLRYAVHVELSLWKDRISFGLDGTFFTDRLAKNPVAVSELDFTPEIIVHLGDFEVHLAYERDMPVDKGGLVQQFVYVLGVWSFDARSVLTKPFGAKNQLVSP